MRRSETVVVLVAGLVAVGCVSPGSKTGAGADSEDARKANALVLQAQDAMTQRRYGDAESLLQRALAILDSTDDGSEVSDVAWPFFVLPARGYTVRARRLLGAAAAGWPPDPGREEELAEAARAAVLAAVNEPQQTPPPAGSR